MELLNVIIVYYRITSNAIKLILELINTSTNKAVPGIEFLAQAK